MANKKRDTPHSQVIEQALLPTNGQVRCPRKDGPGPIWLPSCSGCEHNKGLGFLATIRCDHPSAHDVERAWVEAVRSNVTVE